MKYTVYKIVFPNQKVYIGVTKDLYHRKHRHISDAVHGREVGACDAIREFGKENIRFIELYKTDDYNQGLFAENYFILKYNSVNEGYNSSYGTGSFGITNDTLDEDYLQTLTRFKKGQLALNKGKKATREERINIANQIGNTVSVYKKDSNEYVGQWESQALCADDLGLDKRLLSACLLRKNRRSHKGYIFERGNQ